MSSPALLVLIRERGFRSRFVMSFCQDGHVFRLGFIFTRDTDVSALVQDFIKAQPEVYCGKRLPRLIFLQYIPFCSFLAPKNSQVGTLRWCHISEPYSGITSALLDSDGASDHTECQLCLGTQAGEHFGSPLMALSSCRGCHGDSVWDRGRGQESLCSVKGHILSSYLPEWWQELRDEDRCGFKS